MPFNIRLGVPQMKKFWDDLTGRAEKDELDKNEQKLLKKIAKELHYLSINPKHNSLSTHEIEVLSNRYGMKVWQSYLENKTPSAGRIFWVFGKNRNEITVIGIEPHPEDRKNRGYDKIKLSELE